MEAHIRKSLHPTLVLIFKNTRRCLTEILGIVSKHVRSRCSSFSTHQFRFWGKVSVVLFLRLNKFKVSVMVSTGFRLRNLFRHPSPFLKGQRLWAMVKRD